MDGNDDAHASDTEAPVNSPSPNEQENEQQDSSILALDGTPLAHLRVVVLKRELERRGLSTVGLKKELVQRLEAAMLDENTGIDSSFEPPNPTWVTTDADDGKDVPSPRAGHSLVAFCNRLYLFGGFSDYACYVAAFPSTADQVLRGLRPGIGPHFNSLHEYSFKTKAWRELHPGSPDHTPGVPRPRRHASVVAHGSSLFVYGGFDVSNKVLSDLWQFDIQNCTWARVLYAQPARPVAPVARAEHTAIVYGNRMIVFGGYDGKKKLNDTYVYDFSTQEWSRPSAADTNAPSRRCKHTAVLYKKRMYVLGGFQYNNGENYAMTDMHHLDLETFAWSAVLTCSDCPDALQGHKAVVCEDEMYVLGGKVRSSAAASASDTRTSGLNQAVFKYNFESYEWSEVKVGGNAPPPRQLHAAVAISQGVGRNSICVFGGTDKGKQNYFNDLCELRDIRSPVDLSHDPCARCASNRRLLNKKLFSDVHFMVEGERVYAHRCILYARSEYFRFMFDSAMRETKHLEVPITNVSHKVFLAVMEYLYSCDVQISDGQQMVDLLKAADMFRLEGLRGYCVERIEPAVTAENVAYICEVADTHNAERLKQYCITFILQNFKRVINSKSWQQLLRKDPGGLSLEILEAYSDFNTPYEANVHKRARK